MEVAEINLYKYQQKNLDKVRECISNGHKNIYLCAPTGGGKTVMFSYIAKNAIAKGNKVIIFTDRKELLNQGSNTLKRVGLNSEFIKPNYTPDFNKSLYVAMAETMKRRILSTQYQQLLESADIVVIDEAHKNFYDSLKPFFKGVVIGATATPEPSTYYTALVNEVGVSDLIALGFLSKPTYFGVKLDLSTLATKGKDYDQNLLGSKYNQEGTFKRVFSEHQRLAKDKKTIIFSASIEASKKLVEWFNLNGVEAKHIDANSKDRDDILQWFKSAPNAILSNVGVLFAGYDEPTIECVVLYFATKSVSKFMQSVGRGSRVTPTKNKFTILDFGNNIFTHGFWCDHREWTLERKKKRDGVTPVKDCKCGALLRLSLKICPYCGYNFPEIIKKTPQEIKLEEILKKDLELWKKCCKFVDIENRAKENGYKFGWIVRQIPREDLKAYGEFKGYKPNWYFRYLKK